MPHPLSPANDFARAVGPIFDINASGGFDPATTGEVTAFIVAAPNEDATAGLGAATPALEGVLNHIGGLPNPKGGTYKQGQWLFRLDAVALDLTQLDALFLNTGNDPWLVVVRAGSVRVVEKLVYKRARRAAVQ